MVRIKEITSNNKLDLKNFIDNLGDSRDTFRYFNKRDLSIISNHAYTILAFNNKDEPIGYGHLDQDGGKTWLGIAVISKEKGNGLGKILLSYLINKADSLNVDLYLTVDKINIIASKLYEKCGFGIEKNVNEDVLLMKRKPKKNQFYVSTVAFSKFSLEQIITLCKDNNLALEFSSGLSYKEGIEETYTNCDLLRMPHNYFAAPNPAFVINLASTDEIIRRRSINHCIQGLELAKFSKSPFFAAHAGFCIDPNPQELGKKIKISSNFDISQNEKIFISSVREILVIAEELEIDFLIENNVLSPFNYNGLNPFLCCESKSINWLFKEIKSPRLGLLLDTAHLKVSCETLHLNLFKEIESIKSFIRGIHHSDNDGTKDNNEHIGLNYWFLQFQNQFSEVPHVLEVKDASINEILSQLNILKSYGN